MAMEGNREKCQILTIQPDAITNIVPHQHSTYKYVASGLLGHFQHGKSSRMEAGNEAFFQVSRGHTKLNSASYITWLSYTSTRGTNGRSSRTTRLLFEEGKKKTLDRGAQTMYLNFSAPYVRSIGSYRIHTKHTIFIQCGSGISMATEHDPGKLWVMAPSLPPAGLGD